MSIQSTPSKNPPWYISGIVGSLGQVTELTLAGQLFNRIATAQQANPEFGIKTAIQHIYKKNKWRGFFDGYRWNVGMSIAKGFTRWSFNNAMFSISDRIVSKKIQKEHSWIVPLMVGIGGAALETTLYLCPLESLKTREMTEQWVNKTHMWKVIRTEGYPIFFRGWTGLFPRQAVTWATYLLVYDKYRSAMINFRKGKEITTIDKILMNFMTGATAAMLTTPFDCFKTQRQKVDPLEKKNIISSMNLLVKKYGFKGIYRSLPMRLCRSGFYAVATFSVMDFFNALPARMKL
jgi:hypothetical protein